MTKEINDILKMFNSRIPTINSKKTERKYILGKGLNGSVYLVNYKNKLITLKIQKNYSDAPNFIFNNTKMICSNTHINDLLISFILSDYYKDKPYIQKFLGYEINKKELLIYKEYIELTLIDYLKKSDISLNDKIITFINIFFILYLTFQNDIKGFHEDLKPPNILLKKTNLEFNEIKINGKKYKIPIKGFIPVIIDNGSSSILSIKNKNQIIKRFNSKYYFEKTHKCYLNVVFNYYYDIYLFYEYIKKKYINVPKIIYYVLSDINDNLGKEYLTVENILNHKVIKKYLI